ncbi:MAG: restriction endonuclease subunit S, partial [Anaerolineales bacterium]
IGAVQIPFSTLAEQRAIAAFLDRETERLDALIAGKERQIEFLQEKRAALISHAVTKGLDPTVQMKDSGIEWLGEIPVHWEVGSVKRYFSVELGKMLNRSTEDGSGIMKPYIRAANVHWSGVELDISGVNEMEFSPNQLDRYRLQPGDLLVTEGGVTVGRSIIWNGELDECYYQNSLNRVISLPGSPVSAKFLYYWMYFTKINGYVDLLAGKATFGHLTNVMLKDFLMPAPGGLEQHAITQFLDRKTAEIDALIVKVQESIDILKEYRTALISAAVAGKIDVRQEVA